MNPSGHSQAGVNSSEVLAEGPCMCVGRVLWEAFAIDYGYFLIIDMVHCSHFVHIKSFAGYVNTHAHAGVWIWSPSFPLLASAIYVCVCVYLMLKSLSSW